MEYASNEVDTETTTNVIDRFQSTGLLGQGAHSFEVGSEVLQPPLFMHASDSPAISHQLVQRLAVFPDYISAHPGTVDR